MKRMFMSLAIIFLLMNVAAQDVDFGNTIEVREGDSEGLIVEKAAHVIPTQNQLSALRNEFIAFIHFGPNSFTGMEWGSGKEDPKVFDLKELDTDQWCRSIKAAGMQMVVFTAKHHDGFVLWQSRYTRHGVMSTAFCGGKGDVLRDLSASCRKYGLKLGIYLSPADLYQIEHPEGLYGNLSEYRRRTIPRSVPGREFKDKRRFEFVVDDYNEYFLNQLFELLTEYGPVEEVWFDGAHPKRKGGQTYNYAAWKELIKTLAPKAVIFGKEDVRWCGNEAGGTRRTEWNVMAYGADPDTMVFFPDLTDEDLGSRERLYGARYLHYQQAETNTSIREGWFYRDDVHQKTRSADDVFDIYERSVGGNSTFLLNVPPNKEGRFSAKDVEVLAEVGRRISDTYEVDLLEGARGPKELLDGDDETFVLVKEGDAGIVLETAKPITINRLVLQEAVGKRGERVEEHVVDVWERGAWRVLTGATNVGYKRILRFSDVTTTRLRVRVLGSRLTPALSTVSAHYYRATAPELVIRRGADGVASIAPKRAEFGWKAHGENTVENLSAGFKIFYTTDGSEPTAASREYVKPFAVGNEVVKAVAVLNGCAGAVCSERFGLVKRGWKVASVSSETENHRALAALDADNGTYWASAEEKQGMPFIVIDLGREEEVKGFAYTPQKEHSGGMMARGVVWVSSDGESWKEAGVFAFGNLINDPEKRYHFFDAAVSARYVKVEATEIAAGGRGVTVAEVDVF